MSWPARYLSARFAFAGVIIPRRFPDRKNKTADPRGDSVKKLLALSFALFCTGCATLPLWFTDQRKLTAPINPMRRIIVVGNADKVEEQMALEDAFKLTLDNFSPALSLQVIKCYDHVFQGDRKDPNAYKELLNGNYADGVLLISYHDTDRVKMLNDSELLPVKETTKGKEDKGEYYWHFDMLLYSAAAKQTVWVGESELLKPLYVLNSDTISRYYFITVLGDLLAKNLVAAAPKK
jgi:hypothetical protein